MSYYNDYIRMQIDHEYEAECDAKDDLAHADDPRPCVTGETDLPPSYLVVVDGKEYCSLHLKDAVRGLRVVATDGLPF